MAGVVAGLAAGVPAVPGMVLVLWVVFVPAPVVILALLVVLVWTGVRIDGTLTGRRYCRLRGLH